MSRPAPPSPETVLPSHSTGAPATARSTGMLRRTEVMMEKSSTRRFRVREGTDQLVLSALLIPLGCFVVWIVLSFPAPVDAAERVLDWVLRLVFMGILLMFVWKALVGVVPWAGSVSLSERGVSVVRWPFFRTIRWDRVDQVDLGYKGQEPALVGTRAGRVVCRGAVPFVIRPDDVWWDELRGEIMRRGKAGPLLLEGEVAPWTQVDVNLRTGKVTGKNSGRTVTPN